MAGFTKFDNDLLQKTLTSDLTKRQMKILLLIIRFSFGYQKSYAILRQNDFTYAGVSPYCIKDELKKLVKNKVIIWNPKKDTFRVNPNLTEWAVDKPVKNPGENLRRYFKIATKNSTKQQMALYRNSNSGLAKTAILYRERNKKKDIEREELFLKVLRDYFLRVAPLSESEMHILQQVVDSYSAREIKEAIDTVSLTEERSFSHFLKVLDGLSTRTRRGRMSSIRGGIRNHRKEFPNS